MKTKTVRKILTMDKLTTKEDEVERKEIIDKMEEGNQEDRTEVLRIKEIPEDTLKDTTDLNQDNTTNPSPTEIPEDNLKDTTDLNQDNSTNPSPTEENLDPNPTKDNIILKANQKKE